MSLPMFTWSCVVALVMIFLIFKCFLFFSVGKRRRGFFEVGNEFEEFYVPGEKLDMNRFRSLGVIEEAKVRPMEEIDRFFTEMEEIFSRPSFTKEEVVSAIKRFIPNFEHEEKGKNLDQKM